MSKTKINKSVLQNFDNCEGATLWAEPLDLLRGIGIFYKLNIKKVSLVCDETDTIIKKKYWNDQTRLEAKELKRQLKITKGGWYLYGAMILFVIIGISYAYFYGKVKAKNYVTKSREEQQALRAVLNEGDLIRTTSAIYKFVSSDDKSIKFIKSKTMPLKHMSEYIDAARYKDESFEKEIIVNKQSFLKNGMINYNLKDEYGGSEAVFQIHDGE